MGSTLTDLINGAPWREAVTYRHTWLHEYVLTEEDNQRELLQEIIALLRAGEGVAVRYFNITPTYLFFGECKYWFMVSVEELDPNAQADYVLNRAHLFHERRDLMVQSGDTAKPEDYPAAPFFRAQV